MKVEGTGGAAVTRINDPDFQMFETKSGRDIHSDLERAHRPVESPIKLKPLTPAEEAALYSEDRPARRKLIPPARARVTREPATPARLPASGPGPRSGATPGPSVAPQPTRVGRGQTTRTRRARYDHDLVVALYQDGYSPNQISRKVGCTRQTVVNILDARGIQKRAYTTPKPEPTQQVPAPEPTPEPTPTQAPDLRAASAAIVDHMRERVSLPTTVRRLAQAGFSTAEISIYCGVDESAVVEALLSIVRQQVSA